MKMHASGRSWSALLLMAVAGCAPGNTPESPSPTDEPLPPGTYELTAQASYRDDDDTARHTAFASFGARLYVNPDGTVELYDGERKCTDFADLPDQRNTGRRPRVRGHSFTCGGRSWSLWGREGKVVGRMSAPVTEMVQSRMKCIEYSFSTGHQVCERYGVEVQPRATRVSAAVSARRAG